MFTVVVTLVIHLVFQVLYFLVFLPGYMGSKLYETYAIKKEGVKPWERGNWG
jgi:hypothetical protein